MVEYGQILYEVTDRVALVTLNRPDKLNAMTAQMGAEMSDAMAEADGDDAVRAVVVTGAGKGFCAGADLGGGDRFAGGWGSVEGKLRTLTPQHVRKPVIVAINGHAVGAGLTWTLQGDVRFVAEDAKLAFAFPRRGVLPELGSHAILPRLVGQSKAAELLFSGRTFSGAQAAEWGIASEALPAAEVVPAALALAREIATYSAPLPVAISKRLIWEGMGVSLSDFRRKEGALFTFTTRHPDAREGTKAFFEKREPSWQGSVNDEYPEWPG